jgi:hypothetical protein
LIWKWRRSSKPFNASSPVESKDITYVSLLNRDICNEMYYLHWTFNYSEATNVVFHVHTCFKSNRSSTKPSKIWVISNNNLNYIATNESYIQFIILLSMRVMSIRKLCYSFSPDIFKKQLCTQRKRDTLIVCIKAM